MLFQRKLLSFYLIATLGFSITSLATFLSIETFFHSVGFLGLALSLRTFSSCLLGYQANRLIKKINIKNAFILGLILGVIAIVSLFIGFYYHNFIVVLIGIVLIGLPMTLFTILLTITLRISCKDSEVYRSYSGSRELILGVARLLACLLAPMLLLATSINAIIGINVCLYVFSILFFFTLDLKQFSTETLSDSVIKINHLILKSKDTWIYGCQITASLALIALVPLLASSDQIALTGNVPLLLRQSLWSIEALTMIFGSVIYLIAKRAGKNELVKAVLMLNGTFLVLFLYSNQAAVVVSVVALISMMIMLSFYIFRDDYIVAAGENTRLIEAHAAFSAVMKDLICSISPVVLSYALINFRLDITVAMIILVQLGLYLGYLMLSRSKVNNLKLESIS